jgi:hypothetical protein
MTIRLLSHRTDTRSGVPYITTTVRVFGAEQIATFERMCETAGRQPHELASDIVLDELWLAGGKPPFRRMAREQRRWRLARFFEGMPPMTAPAAPDPLAVHCRHCDAVPGQRCMTVSDWAHKPHAPRRKLALAVAAHTDPALDEHFPRLGPCGICGVPGLDQRHRVVDAMAERMAAGEPMEDVAGDYGKPVQAAEIVLTWALRWPGVWE